MTREMDGTTVKAIEDRRVTLAVSVFNMGTLDEKIQHAKRIGEESTWCATVHLDMYGNEVYTAEEMKEFYDATGGMDIQVHSMLSGHTPTREELEEYKQAGVSDYFFHPSLVGGIDAGVGFAGLLREADLDAFGVIDHNTAPEVYAEDSPLFDPACFAGAMVMTVRYGQAGQAYLTEAEETIRLVRRRMHPCQKLWVDGGITDATAPLHLGVDGIVSGSYLVRAEERGEPTAFVIGDLLRVHIAIGSDHAGYELKQEVIRQLKAAGYKVFDAGCYTPESSELTDYPHYARAVANMFPEEDAEAGILICGTGQGMVMAANKMPGIRAAIGYSEEVAALAKRHNDANILCLGGRQVSAEQACRMVDAWLSAKYEGERHQRRLDKLEMK